MPVRLARITSPNMARILAARLESEGIECHLSGGVDSPYRLTVGPMAQVDIWVRPEDVDDARTVLLVAEVDDTLGGRLSDERSARRVGPLVWFAAAVVLVAIFGATFVRFI
jgi:hypothetical protein